MESGYMVSMRPTKGCTSSKSPTKGYTSTKSPDRHSHSANSPSTPRSRSVLVPTSALWPSYSWAWDWWHIYVCIYVDRTIAEHSSTPSRTCYSFLFSCFDFYSHFIKIVVSNIFFFKFGLLLSLFTAIITVFCQQWSNPSVSLLSLLVHCNVV